MGFPRLLLRFCCFTGTPRRSTSTASTTVCPTAVYMPTLQILLSATSSVRTVHLVTLVRLCRAIRELPNFGYQGVFRSAISIISYISCVVNQYWQFLIHLFPCSSTPHIIRDVIVIARLSIPSLT